ncbi:conserved hypothetical protein [uncultured Alphaproteobacteria bacterium]|uniref:Palmitoyl-protein thioesterase ABHD10, mitochondrial n=1 Tax=uncultured Alphaproteobacteria bacterium TaxID=91750 RepID=A0A212KHX4_9PROT|nr:conserved hypothetical protein [uncultured Alphaproteobacteria bacterium]
MPDPIPGRHDCGILARADGASIAYRRVTPGDPETPFPTVVFLHGLLSDMEGGKAVRLAEHAESAGFGYVRFDMFGHGLSSGAFADAGVGRWRDDALAVIDDLTEGPLILVGSSMGGWVALLAALARPERVRALIGIAPAPDFTTAMEAALTAEQAAALARGEIVHIADAEEPCGTYPVGRALLEEGRGNLLLGGPIRFSGPVRILQGQRDASVDWHTALAIAERLTGDDVQVALIKDGDHRLSRPQDLALLTHTLDTLLALPSAEA